MDLNKDIGTAETEKKSIVLMITLDDNGIKVDGPIKNEPISLWLLEKAKDIIKAANIQDAQPKIQPAGGIMNFVRSKLK